MDIGSIFLILALLLLTALYISRPFFDRGPSTVGKSEHELSSLLAERDRILIAIQELDFDYTLGKISEEDYPAQRKQLVLRGAEILRQLDEKKDASRERASTRLLAAIQSGEESPAPVNHDDEIETLIAERRRERQDKSAGFCPQCGGPVVQSDRFCPKCGASLS